MNEDFVSFVLAKKLKEKGFREKCLCYYNDDNIEYNYDSLVFNHEMYISHNSYDNIWHRDNYDAPTISQVLKWLREEKGYHIEFIGNACGYLFIVSDIPSKGGTDRYCSDYSGPNDGGTWDTYEEAALAGIEYVLDNLI